MSCDEYRSKWTINAYATWLKTSVGQDWINAKKSLQAVERAEDPAYRWPTDVRGEPVPTERGLRVWISGGFSVPAPAGWVHVNGFAELRHLMLAQIVAEFSIVDANEAVDFIASNFYNYGTIFWPRDGFTERAGEEHRIAALTNKLRKLTDFAEVKLVTTRDSQGHPYFHVHIPGQASE